MGTTNYTNAFIEVAPDCTAATGEVPPEPKAASTVASLQHGLVAGNPYAYTSDDLLFAVHATRKAVPADQLDAERDAFFAKDQACLRASPLPKRYGWGIHHDAESRIALVPVGSDRYRELAQDPDLKHVTAMRSKRA